jgi:cytochrome c-type biogenesis protein CcmH/NrfG
MKYQLLISGLLSAGLAGSGFGQAKGGGATNTGAPSNPNAENTSGVGKYANWDQVASHQRGSLVFQGKVVVEGGQLPWDPIPVVVKCNGTTRFNTVTDAKGVFQIAKPPTESEVVGVKGDKPDASQLIGCEVQADLEGFQSTTLTIANRTIMDNPDIGTISLHQDERAKGSVISPTTAAAPKDALKSFDKARGEELSKHPDNAQHDLEKAVKADPQFAEAWYHLGKIEETTKPKDAWDAYSKSTAADPQFLPPYEHMAALAAQEKRWQDVVDATDHALKLDPAGSPQIWYFSAVGNYNLGHQEPAEKAATTALAMDPNHVAPNTEQLLAVILAGRQDYAGALGHLRNCLAYLPPGPNADLVKQQVAQLEKIVPSSTSK